MLSADQMNSLKSEVKELMQCRTGYGSLETYGGSSYDFQTQPAKDVPIKTEHGQKTVDLILKINDYEGLSPVKPDEPIPQEFNEDLIAYVRTLREKPIYGSENDCAAYCTGLCTSQCSGTCTDTCTGSCGGNCTGSCTGQTYVAPYSDYSDYYDYSDNFNSYNDTYSNEGTFNSYADNPIFSNLYSEGFGDFANDNLFTNYHHR